MPTPQPTKHTRHFRNSSFCPQQKSSAPTGTSLDNRDAAVRNRGAPHCKQPTGEHTGSHRGGDSTCCHGARDELRTSRGWAHLAPGGIGPAGVRKPGDVSRRYPARSCALRDARGWGQAACSEESAGKSKLQQRSSCEGAGSFHPALTISRKSRDISFRFM